MRFLLSSCLLFSLSLSQAQADKKKKEELPNQTLTLPKEPPAIVSGQTRRLVFVSVPAARKGLLSQQTRDAVRTLWRDHHGATVLKIRALVAGTGDLRRVQTVVSEEFSDHKLPLPALTVVQVGALPDEGSQVHLEAVLEEKREVESYGVVLLAAQAARAAGGGDVAEPLVRKSLAGLRQAMDAAQAGGLRRLSCFVDTLRDAAAVRTLVEATFPDVAFTLAQSQRAPLAEARCDGVAGSGVRTGVPVRAVTAANGELEALDVQAGEIAWTGLQLGFGSDEASTGQTFARLRRTLDGVGKGGARVALVTDYPLTGKAARLTADGFGRMLPAGEPVLRNSLLLEGLPSMDAAVGVEAVAVVR